VPKLYYADFFAELDWAAYLETGKAQHPHNDVAMILGAYLMAMKERHGVDLCVTGTDFARGKVPQMVSRLLKYFVALAEGDKPLGVRYALKYIKYFVSQPKSSLAGRGGYTREQCFSKAFYQYWTPEPPKYEPKVHVTNNDLFGRPKNQPDEPGP
jgi:hypothetical protein